jgi:hypothetical protein
MWTWCEKMGLGMEAITRWQLRLHIFPMQGYQKNWSVNKGTCKPQLNETKAKTWPYKKKVKTPIINNNLGHILYGITTYILGFNILDVISRVLMSTN